MKVLYSTQSVIEYDGKHYYNNAVKATYPRYLTLGNEITVLTHVENVITPRSEMIEDDVVKFVFIDKINSIISLLKRGRIKNIIEEEVKKTDVCVVHMNLHGVIVIECAKKFNKPVLSVVGSCAWNEYWYYNWKGKLIAPFAFLCVRKAQKNVPFSIYVTNHYLQRRYPTTGKWIACSNVNMKTGDESALVKRLNNINSRQLSGRCYKIGTSASIDVTYKGHEYVIKSLGELKKNGIIIEYHLLGKGDPSRLEKIALKHNVAAQIFFHGGVPYNEVIGFLDDIDIYIQPSLTEGLPRALIEAMSRGCLCIGTNAGGIPELLSSEYIVPTRNSSMIAKILMSLNISQLIDQAKINFEKAKEYDREVLNNKRNLFLNDIKLILTQQ